MKQLPNELGFIEPVLVFLNADLQATPPEQLATLLRNAAKAAGLEILGAQLPFELAPIAGATDTIAATLRGEDPSVVTERFVREAALLLQAKASSLMAAMIKPKREPHQSSAAPRPLPSRQHLPYPKDLKPLFEALNQMMTSQATRGDSIGDAPYTLEFPRNKKTGQYDRYLRFSPRARGIDTAVFRALLWLFSDARWFDVVGLCPIPHCDQRFFMKKRRSQRFCSKLHRDRWAQWAKRKDPRASS